MCSLFFFNYYAAFKYLLLQSSLAAASKDIRLPTYSFKREHESNLNTGSMVVVQAQPASEVLVGDVITYRQPGSEKLTTHRVVEISKEEGSVLTEVMPTIL